MIRLALYIGGLAAAVGAWIVWQDQKRAMRKVPVAEAAEKLKAAWADYHTRA